LFKFNQKALFKPLGFVFSQKNQKKPAQTKKNALYPFPAIVFSFKIVWSNSIF